MTDEAETGPVGAADRPGHPGGGAGEQSPLQTRAEFLKNRSWELVVSLNRGACERGGAQRGISSETADACSQEWEALRSQILTLTETLDCLRGFHRKAPFLFFNGNTFANIGRELSFAFLPK